MSTRITKKEINAIYEISKAITSDMYLEDILKLIVSVTAEITGSKICSIMLVDEKTKTIKIRATQAMSDEYIKKGPLKIGEGIAGKVVKEARPIFVEDVRENSDYKYKDIAKKENLVSMLSVPMKVKNKVIGVLNVYTPHIHNFSEKEIEVISSIANQAAMRNSSGQSAVILWITVSGDKYLRNSITTSIYQSISIGLYFPSLNHFSISVFLTIWRG